MTATVHVLHLPTPGPAGFLRVGHTGHRKLEQLQAAGRLQFPRLVFDAAHVLEQKDFLKRLQAIGCETILDPNFAEMAMAGRFDKAVSKLSWANADRPWRADDFGREKIHETAKKIAEAAVSHGVTAVLAPTNLIELDSTSWRTIDLRMCEALRRELDQCGARRVQIDYQLITTMSVLKDANARQSLMQDVSSLPIDNVWIKASGFGATATGAATRHFIEVVRDLHELGRPLVADGVGGLAGLAAVAFGAVGGMCHGVGQRESFDAGQWKRPSHGGGGGSSPRVYIAELDRYFKEEHLKEIFSARRGRALLACNDPACCPHGAEDMFENSHVHFITQRFRQLTELSNVPELRRVPHFMLKYVEAATRTSRLAARLKIEDDAVAKPIQEAKVRIGRIRDVLTDLHLREGNTSRSRSPRFRGELTLSNENTGQAS
jgi:hypothetical protein